MIEWIIIILTWGAVGGFDWIKDIYECINAVEMEYLKQIAVYFTEIEHLKDINECLNNENEALNKEIDLFIEKDVIKDNQILHLKKEINLLVKQNDLMKQSVDQAHKLMEYLNENENKN